MKDRLASLGFQMPLEPLTYKGQLCPLEDASHAVEVHSGGSSTTLGPTSSYDAIGRSAKTLVNPEAALSPNPLQTRPLKRQRIGYPQHEQNLRTYPSQQRRLDSRDLMPPPAKPLSRMRSIKKFFPTFRKKPHDRTPPILSENPAFNNVQHTQDVQMLEDESWENLAPGAGRSESLKRPSTRYSYSQSDTPYMTGALPAGQNPRMTSSPQPSILSNIGANSKNAEFSFRSSIKPTVQQMNPLPSEPSYIRLFDGLNHNSDFDFGLADPRQSGADQYQPHNRNRQYPEAHDSRPQHGIDAPKRWSFGHAFLHQSPNGASSSAYPHPDPLRSNPASHDANDWPSQEPINPITPVPARSQQQTQSGESVVSPFFKSSNRNSHVLQRARVAEPEDSSLHHSDAYQFRRRPVPANQTDWREPRTLNGLSFFNSPLNGRHEAIDHRFSYVNADPFMLQEQSYKSSGRSLHPRQPAAASRSAIPFLSLKRSSNPQAAPLPSPMPSIVASERPLLRSSSAHRNNLANAGVRGSQVGDVRLQGKKFSPPKKTIFTSAGRRTIRR